MIEDKNPKRTPLSELGEFKLIDHLTEHFKINHKSTVKGVGDDAAVLSFGKKQIVVSTDLLVEGVHFDLSYVPLKHLGYKAVMVNLSDVYAMNAKATQITVSIAVSNRFPLEALEELYAGITTAAELYKIDVVGGDTTSSTSGLIISITAIGEVEEGNDMQEILNTLKLARDKTGKGRPVVILLKTEMGNGVDFMMGSHKWHGIPPSDEQLESALAQNEETLGDY